MKISQIKNVAFVLEQQIFIYVGKHKVSFLFKKKCALILLWTIVSNDKGRLGRQFPKPTGGKCVNITNQSLNIDFFNNFDYFLFVKKVVFA